MSNISNLSSSELSSGSSGVGSHACTIPREFQSIAVSKSYFAPLPRYLQLAERRKSFNRAPLQVVIQDKFNPSELSEAGLYYDYDEQTQSGVYRCFSCNATETTWKFDTNPFVEHYKRSPSCTHALQMLKQRNLLSLLEHKNKSSFTEITAQNRLSTDEVDGKSINSSRHGKIEFDGSSLESDSGSHPNLNNCVAEDTRRTEDRKEHISCTNCHKNTREVMFAPCYHLVSCSDCSNKTNYCFVCNRLVTARLPVRFDEKN